MKIHFQEDFIYWMSRDDATLILRNCERTCAFCPASKLKTFRNYAALNGLFDFSCKTLTIYGNVNCSYIESFLKKLKQQNPSVFIRIIGCDCVLTQFIELEYNHIIYPDLTEYFKVQPKEFILPATGDPVGLAAFASRYASRYPHIKIRVQSLDAADGSVEFWTDTKIEEFQKRIDAEDFRI